GRRGLMRSRSISPPVPPLPSLRSRRDRRSRRATCTSVRGAGHHIYRLRSDQRLLSAWRMLTSPTHLHCTIGAIALEAGFSDLSYFNRSFRRRYGASPSEVRAGAARDFSPTEDDAG